MKKSFAVALMSALLLTWPFLPAQAAFQMGKDDLCFLNKDPDLAKFGFWGQLGAKEGVCQGIAGLSKIFKENVEFQPYRPKNNEQNLKNIFETFQTYRQRPQQKIVITGYPDLNNLCKDYRDIFLRQSIELNRDIAVQDILPLYPEFNYIKDRPTDNWVQQVSMDITVRRQRNLLGTGRYPLILVYSHVMLVTDIRWTGQGFQYTYYDSNSKELQGRHIGYGSDGLPVLGQRMIWDITLSN